MPRIEYTIYDVGAERRAIAKEFTGDTARLLIDIFDRFAGRKVVAGHYCEATRCGVSIIERR